MPDWQSNAVTSSLLPIERPLCPKCTNRLSLVRTSPAENGSDVRTFECAKCEFVHIVTVGHDRIRSTEAGWPYAQFEPLK